MSRVRTPYQNSYPYFVSGRPLCDRWFDLPLNIIWEIFTDYLCFIDSCFAVKILGFLLDPHGYYLIISTPEQNLDKAMKYLLREASRHIAFESHRINQIFHGPYRRCLLPSRSAYLNAYKFVYRIPIEGGTVKLCEEYPFSALHGLLGQKPISIPIYDNILFSPEFRQETLNWLNVGHRNDFFEVGRALEKPSFRFCKSNSTGRLVRPADFIF